MGAMRQKYRQATVALARANNTQRKTATLPHLRDKDAKKRFGAIASESYLLEAADASTGRVTVISQISEAALFR